MTTKPRARRRVAATQHKRDVALGYVGERTPASARLAHHRAAFLRVAADVVPELVPDLIERAYPAVRDAAPGALVRVQALGDDQARAVAEAWALRWRLTDDHGQAAPWVVSSARRALYRFLVRPYDAAQLLAPPVIVCDTTDASIPRLGGSTATRSLRPLRWLALRLCGGLAPAEIAGAEFQQDGAHVTIAAIEVENARQARALGLCIPPRPRGRPPRSARA